MKYIHASLKELIQLAYQRGLDPKDIKTANDLLKNHEFGLCFDILVTQMYEFDVKISREDYEKIIYTGVYLNMNKEIYECMRTQVV